MEGQDWKAALGAAFNISANDKQEEEQSTERQVVQQSAAEQQGKKQVNIILDKKGRNGKKATIIEGLDVDDDALKELAARLKRVCGVGGSARGGEILIQGDKRDAVLAELCRMGFKARII